MNDKTRDTGNKVSARRRLVRGVFAAPVALTLYSGSVAARSIRNCVTKQVASPIFPPESSAPGTTYVRVQLQRFYGTDGTTVLANRFSRWIKGDHVVALQAAATATPYIVSGQWQLYDRGVTNDVSNCGNGFNPASAYAPPYSSLTPPGTIITGTPSEAGTVACGNGNATTTVSGNGPTPDAWVALRMNGNGDIVGVVGIDDPTGSSAIYHTCWSSFRLG